MSKSVLLQIVYKNGKKSVIAGYHQTGNNFAELNYQDAKNLIDKYVDNCKAKHYRIYAHDMSLGVFYKTERTFSRLDTAESFFHDVIRQFKGAN